MASSSEINWKLDPRIRLLQELVEINSGTNNFVGVDRVQDRVAKELKKMGFHVSFKYHSEGKGHSGKFLLAELAAPNHSGHQSIDFLTHADTVFEKDSGFLKFSLNISKGIATGPGVIDDKGGIVVALTGLQRFLERQKSKKSKNNFHFRFICAPSEETGSPGFLPLFEDLSQHSRMVLGFEPSLESGAIVESRRGNWWLDIHVQGKEGHAGRDHAHCVNAAHELAHKIVQLHQLTDYKRDVTVSTGQIEGGSKVNIVCGHAHATVDTRFPNFKARDEIQKKIKKILDTPSIAANQDGERPRTSYTVLNDCPPFDRSLNAKRYISKYLEIIEEIEGRSVQSAQAGGAADSNNMSRPGLVILDGLGASGGGMHRQDEFIYLESLETRSEALARFLEFVSLEFARVRV